MADRWQSKVDANGKVCIGDLYNQMTESLHKSGYGGYWIMPFAVLVQLGVPRSMCQSENLYVQGMVRFFGKPVVIAAIDTDIRFVGMCPHCGGPAIWIKGLCQYCHGLLLEA